MQTRKSTEAKYLSDYKRVRGWDVTNLQEAVDYINGHPKWRAATRIGYLNSLQHFHPEVDFKPLIDHWREELPENTLSERQKSTLDGITIDGLRQASIETSPQEHPEEQLIFEIASTGMPRNDLRTVTLDGSGKNCINGGTVVIRFHKTSKTNGPIRIPLSKRGMESVAELSRRGNTYLFEREREPISSVGFNRLVDRTLKERFGTGGGSSGLRKLYLTSKYGDVVGDMKRDAKRLGHSIGTAQRHYIQSR